jgi:hypothetical protein
MAEIGWSRGAITLDLAGYDVVVPYRSADVWLESLTGNPVNTLLALVRETTAEILMSELASGEMTGEELAKASYSLFEQAIPFKWWEGYRLLMLSTTREVVGGMTLAGVDPAKISVGVWVSAVYAMLTQNADSKAKGKFDMQLSIPPEGIEDDGDDDIFNTMVQQARTMPGMR